MSWKPFLEHLIHSKPQQQRKFTFVTQRVDQWWWDCMKWVIFYFVSLFELSRVLECNNWRGSHRKIPRHGVEGWGVVQESLMKFLKVKNFKNLRPSFTSFMCHNRALSPSHTKQSMLTTWLLVCSPRHHIPTATSTTDIPFVSIYAMASAIVYLVCLIIFVLTIS